MSLFVRMVREEWRLHAAVFGGRRFAAFPLAIAGMVALGTWLLGLTDVEPAAILAGIHVLVVFFGLQVGTIGLIGRDALRDVLGDVTPLVFAARSLPLSWRRLLATFLVKDLVYYGGFFLVPALAGFGAVSLGAGLAPGTLALASVTVLLSFGLGVAGSLALAGLATRSGPLALGAVLAVVAGIVVLPVDAIGLTPYALLADPSLASLAGAVAPPVALGAVGVALFEPTESATEQGRRRRLEALVTWPAGDWLTRRPLLAVARSSGSVWKVAFSMGVLFGVVALVLQAVSAETGLQPGAGVAFGTLLGLGAFTTYSWVTRFDDPREYLRYPIEYGSVFAGTRDAGLLLSVAAGLGYLALAAIWFPVVELLAGLVVLPAMTLYVLGVAAFLTGRSPNEVLFDTPRFVVFGVALSAVALPLLIAALARPQAPLLADLGGAGIALVAGGVGYWLHGRAGPRWHDRLRE